MADICLLRSVSLQQEDLKPHESASKNLPAQSSSCSKAPEAVEKTNTSLEHTSRSQEGEAPSEATNGSHVDCKGVSTFPGEIFGHCMLFSSSKAPVLCKCHAFFLHGEGDTFLWDHYFPLPLPGRTRCLS